MAPSGVRKSVPPPNRRRDKPQLSCDPCRRKKRQCDRERPCGRCVSLGDIESCKYASNSHVPERRVSDREADLNISEDGISSSTFGDHFVPFWDFYQRMPTAVHPHALDPRDDLFMTSGHRTDRTVEDRALPGGHKEPPLIARLNPELLPQNSISNSSYQSETNTHAEDQERRKAWVIAATECFGKIATERREAQGGDVPETYHSVFKFPI